MSGSLPLLALSPLDATLMNPLASVANKRLTAYLNPLDATLTKNQGEGATFLRRSDLRTIQLVFDLSPVFSNPCALFCTVQDVISFVFKQIRTLCQKPPRGKGTSC